jgi:hypothetical protein
LTSKEKEEEEEGLLEEERGDCGRRQRGVNGTHLL